MVVCDGCASAITTPVVGADALGAYYPAAYGPYQDPSGTVTKLISSGIRSWLAWRAFRAFPLSAIARMAPGRGIDIGCGRGDLAAGLIARGWRMAGVEPSAEAAAAAAGRGVDVRTGTLADVELEPGRYDAAVFQHSLEHTPEPLADLQRVLAALRPGGVVAITVPNFGNWQPRRLRSRWYHLDVPRHRTHFTARGLGELLRRAGFQPPELRTATSAVGLPATVQYAVAGRCLFPDGLGLRVASGLCVLALPLAVVADRFGGGGDLLHAVARRPH